MSDIDCGNKKKKRAKSRTKASMNESLTHFLDSTLPLQERREDADDFCRTAPVTS